MGYHRLSIRLAPIVERALLFLIYSVNLDQFLCDRAGHFYGIRNLAAANDRLLLDDCLEGGEVSFKAALRGW